MASALSVVEVREPLSNPARRIETREAVQTDVALWTRDPDSFVNSSVERVARPARIEQTQETDERQSFNLNHATDDGNRRRLVIIGRSLARVSRISGLRVQGRRIGRGRPP